MSKKDSPLVTAMKVIGGAISSILAIAFVLFLALKALGAVSWDWVWIFSPLIAGVIIAAVVFVIALGIYIAAILLFLHNDKANPPTFGDLRRDK